MNLSENDSDAVKFLHANVDASKPVETIHYLYFSSFESAAIVADLVTKRGLQCEYREAPVEGEWGVYVTINEVVSESRIKQLREGLSQLAEQFDGEYDGWEAQLRG